MTATQLQAADKLDHNHFTAKGPCLVSLAAALLFGTPLSAHPPNANDNEPRHSLNQSLANGTLGFHHLEIRSVVQSIMIAGVENKLSDRAYGEDAKNRAEIEGESITSGPRFEAIVLRVGFNPEMLTAAGLDSSDVTNVISDASDYLLTHATDLYSADRDCATYQAEVDQGRQLIRSGRGSQQSLNDYRTAITNLAAARNNRRAALNAIFDAGITSLTQAEADLCTTIRANLHWNDSRRLAPEFLTITRTDRAWVELDEALEHERYCSETGESVDAGVRTILTNRRGDATVSTASSNLSTNLIANTIAWQTAVNE